MDDLISRQQAIDAVFGGGRGTIKERLEALPSAQPYTIHSDGRLWITVDDIDKVTAVVVDEHKSKFCKQFYEDYEDAQPEIIRCKDCKYFEPIYTFDKGACGHWHARANASDFCSYAERENNV